MHKYNVQTVDDVLVYRRGDNFIITGDEERNFIPNWNTGCAPRTYVMRNQIGLLHHVCHNVRVVGGKSAVT